MPRQANRFGGGANTNRNGLHFEQTTSLNTALQNAGFIIANHFEVYDRNQLLGYSINQDEFSTIFLRQNGINDRAINSKRWKPDEAFINEIDKTVYIIEKKFQRTSGSVDEKLATFPFKIREYRRLLDPIGYDLVYIYLLSSDWFNVPKYQDYYDYMGDSLFLSKLRCIRHIREFLSTQEPLLLCLICLLICLLSPVVSLFCTSCFLCSAIIILYCAKIVNSFLLFFFTLQSFCVIFVSQEVNNS